MSKHARVLHDATPKGLPRWLRAADNAVRNPNSPGARLYHRRVSNAHLLRERITDHTGPVTFTKWNGSKEYTCSLFCAAMHAQLTSLQEFEYERHGYTGYRNWRGEWVTQPNYVRVETPVTLEQLITFFQEDDSVTLDLMTNRQVTCRVCGTKIKR